MKSIKHWLACLTITGYLGVLSWGIVSHAIHYKEGVHPAMYFVIWDMFCGWSSYSNRIEVIGEGQSGRFYELAPGPWGEFHPYAPLGRRHYDSFGNHVFRLAANNLKHTKHEPMVRVFIVEECWSKKYNLPDHIWKKHFDEPKRPIKYYNVWAVFRPDGKLIERNMSWMSRQYALCISDNPRLRGDTRKGKPFIAISPQNRFQNPFGQGGFSPVGSTLGE